MFANRPSSAKTRFSGFLNHLQWCGFTISLLIDNNLDNYFVSYTVSVLIRKLVS